MRTILLVEDDASVSELVSLALQRAGYRVSVARTGREALDRYADETPDAVLLDLMLPELDGIEVCRRIRATNATVPVIMLTAKSDSLDIVEGLESGADDYVTKPFETKVLLARIAAVLRRAKQPPAEPSDQLRVGELVIDRRTIEVRKRGEPIDLTATEFRLLVELARHPGQVLSREQLLELVWDYDYLGDSRLVDVGIGRLRLKVEDDPSDPRLIKTRRGFGYFLDAG